MKTTLLSKTQVIKNNPAYKSLINAVIRQLGGMESINDINYHGMDARFNGFTWYSDTHDFAIKNRKQIIELLTEEADSLGETVVGMVENFGVFKRDKMDKEDYKNLYRYLGEAWVDECIITNIMAWFAAEEVCRMFKQ